MISTCDKDLLYSCTQLISAIGSPAPDISITEMGNKNRKQTYDCMILLKTNEMNFNKTFSQCYLNDDGVEETNIMYENLVL